MINFNDPNFDLEKFFGEELDEGGHGVNVTGYSYQDKHYIVIEGWDDYDHYARRKYVAVD